MMTEEEKANVVTEEQIKKEQDVMEVKIENSKLPEKDDEEEKHELAPWEIERLKRIQEEDEREKRELEEMKLKAQKQREDFFKKLKQEQEKRKESLQKVQNLPDNNEEDENDVISGWSEVMEIAKPDKSKLKSKEMKNVKNLYIDLKTKK